MKHLSIKILSLIFVALLLYACAKKGRPDGGPIDEIPPEVVKTSPENYSVNFDKQEITISFNEYIVLEDPRNQIIFSPPIEPRPEIQPMSFATQQIKIILPDSLIDNTTYTINFGTSIVDNNEANPLPYYSYVFSTGDYLDSLAIKGKVRDARSRKVKNIISVMLYQADTSYTDSAVFRKTPRYIAYSQDSTNNFELSNLKAGQYKMFAVEDNNSNYTYEPQTDQIGFMKDTITIPGDSIFDISVFKEDQQIDFKRPEQVSRNQYLIGFSGTIDSTAIAVDFLNDQDSLSGQLEKRSDSDSLNLWTKPFLKRDSIAMKISHKKVIDTFTLRPKEIEKDSLKIKQQTKSPLDLYQTMTIKPSIPLTKIDTSKISTYIKKDSSQVDFQTDYFSYSNLLSIKHKKEESTTYIYEIMPGAFEDWLGNKNDTISYSAKTKELKKYGTLDLTINGINNFPVIVQLVDDEDKVIKSKIVEQQKSVNFEFINPGDYFVRIIIDENENGIWDTGNYQQKKQPEDIIYYNEAIKIRAYFDHQQTINF